MLFIFLKKTSNLKSNKFPKYLFWDEIYSKNSKNNYNNIISKIMNTYDNCKNFYKF